VSEALETPPPLRHICVYAGSGRGADPRFADAAEALAQAIVARGLGIVYGGGDIGLMGVLADAALAAGGEVIGVIPQALLAKEVAHAGLTELHVVDSMHERKARMADLARAFIALPGGIGTIEELIEVFTWTQLGLHAKPVAVLNVAGYWDGLLSLLDDAVTQRFLRAEHRALLLEGTEPGALLDALEAWRPPELDKWIDRDDT
jgi:uncharacterized protein (TIGR00730 family)